MTSPSGIGLDFATILSSSIECILYGDSLDHLLFLLVRLTTYPGAIGISLVMFGGTVWALTHGRPKDEINWSMVLVAFVLTILSTIVSLHSRLIQ